MAGCFASTLRFCGKHMPIVFLLLSLASAVLVFVGCILDLITSLLTPSVVLLNVYCLVFALFALSAELRQFGPLRKIVYRWLQYMYFLTYYLPRSIFYILLGFLMLEKQVLMIIAAILCFVTGFLMFLAYFILPLPSWEDPAEMAKSHQDFRRYYYDGEAAAANGTSAAAVGAAPGTTAHVVTSTSTTTTTTITKKTKTKGGKKHGGKYNANSSTVYDTVEMEDNNNENGTTTVAVVAPPQSALETPGANFSPREGMPGTATNSDDAYAEYRRAIRDDAATIANSASTALTPEARAAEQEMAKKYSFE